MRRLGAGQSDSASRGAKRLQQLSEVLRGFVADFFERELEFPKGALVSVSEVNISSDLAEARVGVSVFPISSGDDCLQVVRTSAFELQKHVGSKLTAYRIPKLTFYLDERLEKADRIERLLDTVGDSS